MLWRVRTTLPDRPGALALLAEQCGLADINILGLQIFPGVEAVTDELVLAHLTSGTPTGSPRWSRRPEARRSRAALHRGRADRPADALRAGRPAIVERPMSFPEVVARLFDADSEPAADANGDVMEPTVGEVQVQLAGRPLHRYRARARCGDRRAGQRCQ